MLAGPARQTQARTPMLVGPAPPIRRLARRPTLAPGARGAH
ncbi:MAG: hypothetical protein JWO36_3819, partial [Myxococcales bacterium]|nr:hypothetical protein [Myxococcales bacterium]